MLSKTTSVVNLNIAEEQLNQRTLTSMNLNFNWSCYCNLKFAIVVHYQEVKFHELRRRKNKDFTVFKVALFGWRLLNTQKINLNSIFNIRLIDWIIYFVGDHIVKVMEFVTSVDCHLTALWKPAMCPFIFRFPHLLIAFVLIIVWLFFRLFLLSNCRFILLIPHLIFTLYQVSLGKLDNRQFGISLPMSMMMKFDVNHTRRLENYSVCWFVSCGVLQRENKLKMSENVNGRLISVRKLSTK